MRHAFVLDAVRTPFGRRGGALAGVGADDLAAFVVGEQLRRVPALDPAAVDDVVLGNTNGVAGGHDGAGMGGLLAGLPITVPSAVVNRLGGSSLEAAVQAARAIEAGDTTVMVAGGAESMSRAAGTRAPCAADLKHRKAAGHRSMKHAAARARQDAWALRSHRLAHRAWEEGRYDDLVAPVPGTALTRDESIRPDASAARLAEFAPLFADGGAPDTGTPDTPTAGNTAPRSDGASAVLIGSAIGVGRTGLEPLARIAGRAVVAGDARHYVLAPVEAADLALDRSGITWADVGAVELGGAFAAQTLACTDAWGIDPSIVNAWGGAVALGHPLGASGTRLLGTLAHRLVAGERRWGVAVACVGVRQGVAMVLENVRTGGLS